LLVAVCVALANGLVAQWLPQEQVRALQIPKLEPELAATGAGKSDEKRRTTTISQPTVAAGAPAPKSFTMTSEASGDFKKALEVNIQLKSYFNKKISSFFFMQVCDYALGVTNGENLADIVSLKARFPLIKTWVILKQFNQSPIKNLGLSKSNAVINPIFLL
jgi:hypothetical protein